MSRETQMQNRACGSGSFLIYPDKFKVFCCMMLCVVYVGLGNVLILLVDPTPKYPRVVAQFAGMSIGVVMGIGAIVCLVRLMSSGPALIISHDGIYINSTLFKIGTVEWSEIGGLRVHHVRFQNRLTILVTDPRPILARQPPIRRLVYLLVKGSLIRSGNIVTADGMLPISAYEVVAQIREQFHHELSHYHIVIREQQRR